MSCIKTGQKKILLFILCSCKNDLVENLSLGFSLSGFLKFAAHDSADVILIK